MAAQTMECSPPDEDDLNLLRPRAQGLCTKAGAGPLASSERIVRRPAGWAAARRGLS